MLWLIRAELLLRTILFPHQRRPLNLASAAVCLTLLDFETTLWTDLKSNAKGIGWLRFHCGCSIVTDPSKAVFALITRSDTMPTLNKFKTGNDESPESSTTLIIQTRGLSSSDGKRLTGPGIETFSTLKVEGLTKRFWQDRQSQCDMFPLAVDIVFTWENRLAALPRTTKKEAIGMGTAIIGIFHDEDIRNQIASRCVKIQPVNNHACSK